MGLYDRIIQYKQAGPFLKLKSPKARLITCNFPRNLAPREQGGPYAFHLANIYPTTCQPVLSATGHRVTQPFILQSQAEVYTLRQADFLEIFT